jgi:hypothetical protein
MREPTNAKLKTIYGAYVNIGICLRLIKKKQITAASRIYLFLSSMAPQHPRRNHQLVDAATSISIASPPHHVPPIL